MQTVTENLTNSAIAVPSIQASNLSNLKTGQEVDAYKYAVYDDWTDEKILASLWNRWALDCVFYSF